MKKRFLVVAVSSLLSSMAVAAEEAAPVIEEEKSPWVTEVELGLIRTTGNTETQTAAFKADATYEVEKWRHNGHLEAYSTESEDSKGQSVVSAERYELSGKSDYKITELDYMFGLVKLEKDRFSGFEYDHTVSAGYGRKVIKQDDMELDLEIGPGVRFFKEDNLASDNEAMLRLSASYWWAITDNSKFTQDLSTDIGESFTSTKSVTGIQASISDELAMKFTYTIRNKSKVPVGTEKTDTELAMTLVYTF